jgi:DNA-binding transcriptional regulator YiaG
LGSHKPLAKTIQTPGDWIQAKRHEKNLAPWYLAAKLGVARALVLEWEEGTKQPDEVQWGLLAKILE